MRKESRPKNSDVIHASRAQLDAARAPLPGPPRRRPARRRAPRARRSPAAVVPPGDVTIARSRAGSPRVGEQRRRADEELRGQRLRQRPRQTGGTPASISASATRKRYAGPEPVSAVTASRCSSSTRTTVPTAPRMPSAQARSSSVAVGRAGDRRRPATDERRRVGHRPHDGDAVAGCRLQRRPPTRRRRSTGRASAPAAVAAATAAGTSPGLTAITAAGARAGRPLPRSHPGTAAASSSRRAATVSTTASVGRRGAAGEEPAEQRGAHVPAADDHELDRHRAHGRSGDRGSHSGVWRRLWSGCPGRSRPRGCRSPVPPARTPRLSGEAAGEADAQQGAEALLDRGVERADRPVELGFGSAATGSSPRRNTASSTPIEKWAPTSRSLRRSRCSYSSAAFSSGAGMTYVS